MYDILETPLIKALVAEDIAFYDVMNAFDIKTTIAMNLYPDIYGFVYVSKRGNYHIILNGEINYETQCKVFLHEVKHIVKDLPTMNYIIGLDMLNYDFEKAADLISNL